MSAQFSHPDAAVYVLVADPAIRKQIVAALAGLPWSIQHFESARTLLDSLAADVRGCIVANVAAADTAVLEMLKELNRRPDLAVILLSQDIDVPQAVAAMRAGARDLLPLPMVERALRVQVSKAMSAVNPDIK